MVNFSFSSSHPSARAKGCDEEFFRCSLSLLIENYSDNTFADHRIGKEFFKTIAITLFNILTPRAER